MKKITVTREQQDAINGYWQIGKDLDHLINLKQSFNQHALKAWARPVLQMTSDQIAAAWLGVADIEPEPVNIKTAFSAYVDKKKVKCVDSDGMENIVDTAQYFEPVSVSEIGRKFYILEDE